MKTTYKDFIIEGTPEEMIKFLKIRTKIKGTILKPSQGYDKLFTKPKRKVGRPKKVKRGRPKKT